ncbi:hypothetical protein B0H16DRAFT_1585456, partial [Mycena metata]
MAVVVLESVLYALLLVSASTTLYLRFSRHEVPKLLVWNPVVLFTILIATTSGAHWILTIVRFFDAFLYSADVEQFYLDNSHETQTAMSLLSVISMFIGDAAIIHRLWLIWNRSFPVIILPVMTCFGLLMGGGRLDYNCGKQCLLHRIHSMENLENETHSGAFIRGRNSRGIWGLLFAVASELRSPLQIIMVDLSAVMVGIVNMIIYLRVELQCARPDGSDRTGVVMTSSASIRPYYVNTAST